MAFLRLLLPPQSFDLPAERLRQRIDLSGGKREAVLPESILIFNDDRLFKAIALGVGEQWVELCLPRSDARTEGVVVAASHSRHASWMQGELLAERI